MSVKKINKKRFNKNELKNIIPLMLTNPNEAKKQLEEYLKKYPKDYSTYPYYASILITLGNFEEAEKVLEYAENTLNKSKDYKSKSIRQKNIITTKIRLLAYQEKYEELYQLCSKCYKELQKLEIGTIYFYSRKKTGRLSLEQRETNSYSFRQITEYKESDFLDHIKKHLSEYNQNIEEPNKNLFIPGFKIIETIEEVKKYLLSDKRIFPDFYDDVYIFRYDNCGTENNKTVNFFKVICFHNTKDIITMCPVSENLNIPYIDLNHLNEDTKQVNENIKVRRLSQIEKFNQRYKHS